MTISCRKVQLCLYPILTLICQNTPFIISDVLYDPQRDFLIRVNANEGINLYG